MPDALSRLDQTLGRIVYRAVGVGLAALSLGPAWMAAHAVEAGEPVPGAIAALSAFALVGAAVWCVRRGRRLSDIG